MKLLTAGDVYPVFEKTQREDCDDYRMDSPAHLPS